MPPKHASMQNTLIRHTGSLEGETMDRVIEREPGRDWSRTVTVLLAYVDVFRRHRSPLLSTGSSCYMVEQPAALDVA